MQISVVIPTCERKARLLSLLQNLDSSIFPVYEVIIVDSGNDKLSPADFSRFSSLPIKYISSERSVCIQRNAGIRMARSPWILLCDDDIEIPPEYLQQLIQHVNSHPEAGAVSGLWLEIEKDQWKATHPLRSARELWWKYIFRLGIWGEINCKSTWLTQGVKRYYERKGNHISKAGWPVNTDFTGENSICPVYSLGASLIKKEWLTDSPFDEVLDRHGIGDNYGVVVDFPTAIHVTSKTFVYHHLEAANRLKRSLQYYRRILALDYFAKIKPGLKHVKRQHIVWSLTGNLLSFLKRMDGIMIKATCKAVYKIIFDRNPYLAAAKRKQKVVEPML